MRLISLQLVMLFGLLLLGWVSSAMADNTLLSRQSISRTGNDMRLTVHFDQAMNYLSNFPVKYGDQVDIKLRPISTGITNLAMSSIEDRLQVTKGHGNPIQDIRYEQDEGGTGTLTVEFVKSYQFTVTQSRDHKDIYITLKDAISGTARPSAVAPKPTKSMSASLAIYVLNLQTSTDPIEPDKQPFLKNFRKKYDIYTLKTTQARKTIYQLRLGYFHSLSLVKEDLRRLKPFYPGIWLDKVKPDRQQIADDWFMKQSLDVLEKRVAINERNQAKITAQANSQDKQAGNKSGVAENDKQKNLLTIAKQALISKNYRKAVSYLTHILQNSDKTYHKQAQELLGVTRERQGLPAQAVAAYNKYLKLYPKGADAIRVRQRLNGLLTARSKPNAKLKQVVKLKPSGPKPSWRYFGTFTQFYRNQQSKTDLTSAQTTANSLDSNLSFSGRERGGKWNQRLDFAGTHRYDFLNNNNASNGTIYTMFYELASSDDDFSMRIGRQTHNSDGVLGRFDGVILSKRISHHTKVNFLAGYPVDIFIRDSINTKRSFYAASIKFESILKDLDTKFYYISQKNYGMTDRQAIGNQTQYIDNFKQLFFIADYDIFYKTLNQATFVGNWRNKANSSLNIVADYRKSPLLTTNNAIIGQTSAPDLNLLRNTYAYDQVLQLARDRTATSKSLTISASTQMGPRYQLTGDINVSDLTGTPASGGVASTNGTGTQYYYNLSLIGMNMLSKNDVTILGMRYNTDVTSHTIMANFSTRLNIDKKWRVNPRMSIAWRKDDSGSKRVTYTPRLVTDYRGGRNWRYELELGYQKQETSGATSVNASSSSMFENYYIYLGYIHDF